MENFKIEWVIFIKKSFLSHNKTIKAININDNQNFVIPSYNDIIEINNDREFIKYKVIGRFIEYSKNRICIYIK